MWGIPLDRLIKFTVQFNGDIDKAIGSEFRKFGDQLVKDCIESVHEARDEANYRMRTETPRSEFPYAANPPQRLEHGAMMSHGAKLHVLRRSGKNAEFAATLGWDDFDAGSKDTKYWFYQEHGWRHVGGRHIRGVKSLDAAAQSFLNGMSGRGYI